MSEQQSKVGGALPSVEEERADEVYPADPSAPMFVETLEPGFEEAPGGLAAAATTTPAGLPRHKRRRVPIVVKIAIGWLVLLVFVAIFAHLLPIPDPNAIGDQLNLGPFKTMDHPLGTDQIGRDELSRVIYGGRVSLLVSLLATLVGATIGAVLGCLAGYVRGAADTVVDLFINALLAFPPLLLLIALASIQTATPGILALELALLGIPLFARISRATTLTVVQREFVLAARSLGARSRRVVLREVLPNVLLPVSSYAVLAMGTVMIAEGSLSFLGLGIRPPTSSWGVMVAEGRANLEQYPYQVFVPGVVFLLTVLAFQLTGDWGRGRVHGGSEVR